MAHPLLLEGTDLCSWETFIPENLNLLFAPNMSGVVKDIIKLGPGKYIVTFTSANSCLLYTSPSPRDRTRSRMPSSA